MAIKHRLFEALTAATPQSLGTKAIGAHYGRLIAIKARNYASSAKAGAGTDTACKIKIVDGDSKVVYLDAADRDYATAEVLLLPTQDDTATGLNVTPVDATGAAATAGAGGPIYFKTPITVSVVNGGTATDYFSADIIYSTS